MLMMMVNGEGGVHRPFGTTVGEKEVKAGELLVKNRESKIVGQDRYLRQPVVRSVSGTLVTRGTAVAWLL